MINTIYNFDLSSLLILPPLPSPATREALEAAYHPPLTSTLITLASLRLSKPAVLEIAVPYTRTPSLDQPRSGLFAEVENLLAGLYRLICIVGAQTSIVLDDDGGVDARVILIASDELTALDEQDGCRARSRPMMHGPIVGLNIFAGTRRRWNYIFSVDGEPGQRLLHQYLRLAEHPDEPLQGQRCTVAGGIISSSSRVDSPSSPYSASEGIHTTVAVGGTFDHLHAGHKLLLSATASLLQPATDSETAPRRLIVGITGDELLKKKKYAEYLQCWQQRQEKVVEFLLTLLLFSRDGKDDVQTVSFDAGTGNGRAIHTRVGDDQMMIECVEIQDPFGPTITDEAITALIVSRETRSGGAAVNAKREEKGWRGLAIFEVGVLDAAGVDEKGSLIPEGDSFASKISSTAYRQRKAAHGEHSA